MKQITLELASTLTDTARDVVAELLYRKAIDYKPLDRLELQYYTRMPDRQSRAVIGEIRDAGITVCYSRNGYFLPKTDEDAQRYYLKPEWARAKSILKRLKLSQKSLDFIEEQIRLEGIS